MSININKYNKHEDYVADGNRPQNENCVSLVTNEVVYDKKNVILKPSQVKDNDVCVVVNDNVTGKLRLISISTYDAATLDTERYTVKNFIRAGKERDKHILVAKSDTSTSLMWSDRNRYQIVCDLTANGGFTATITINGAVKTNTVAWKAGDTLQSVIDQWTEVVAAYQLKPTAGTLYSDGETPCMNVICSGYTDSTLTLSDNTGATLYDLSLYCKIDGVLQEETHRNWQAKSVVAMFPQANAPAPSTTQYARSGLNVSYRCGANLAKYKSYYRTGGRATYISETDASSRMSEAGFADLATQSGDALALYNKYHGSWDAYMEASMVQIDDFHRSGIEFQSYDNGTEISRFLASVTTVGFDGVWFCPFLAAYSAAQFSDEGLGVFALPTSHEIAVIYEDSNLADINAAIAAISGTAISTSASKWAVSEFINYTAWIFYSSFGTLGRDSKYNYGGVRPVLASVLED